MIHSTHSEFAASSTGGSRAFHPSHAARHMHTTHGRTDAAASGWSPVIFAEPEISSLWDTSLLDRLSSPLTRYHE